MELHNKTKVIALNVQIIFSKLLSLPEITSTHRTGVPVYSLGWVLAIVFLEHPIEVWSVFRHSDRLVKKLFRGDGDENLDEGAQVGLLNSVQHTIVGYIAAHDVFPYRGERRFCELLAATLG